MHPLRAKILNEPPDIQTRELYIPEWGHAVFIRGFTAAERDRFELDFNENRKRDAVRAMCAIKCCRDEHGDPIFSIADVELLKNQPAAPLSRIYDQVAALSSISPDDTATLEKNYAATLNGSSPSD